MVESAPWSDVWSGSVVVPAHDEEAVLGDCLAALARDPAHAGVRVVVVANGCTDRTAEVARGFADRLPGLVVLEQAEAGKVGALDAGDAAAGDLFPRVYLDADVTLGDGALGGLLEALRTEQALVAAPALLLDDDGADAAVRSFYRVFRALPYASEHLVGLGVYGVSRAGRARFGAFPPLTADDLFVQRLFAAEERVVSPGTFTVRTPRRLRDLVRVRTRVAQGNAEHARGPASTGGDRGSTTGSTGRALLRLAARPSRLPDVATYAAVTALARARARRRPTTWLRDDSTRGPRRAGDRLEVAYLVSQYPAPSHVFIEREVEGLRALGARVETFSVRGTDPAGLRGPTMQREAAATTVLLDDRGALAGAFARLVARHPVAAGRLLRTALGTGEPSVRGRTWQLFYLVEAVLLHAEMRRRGLRHVHVHFANNGADVARLAVALGREVDGPGSSWRWTMTMHGPTEFEAVARTDLAAKLTSAAAVACISDFTRSQVMRLVDPAVWPRLSLVRMSVDTTTYRPGERPPAGARPDAGALRLLSVGRLVPEKAAPVLLDAVAALVARGVRVDVRLVGAGPLEPALRDQVRRLGLEGSVELTGALGQDRLPELYRWADVFCLPSFQEGLPVVLMEAMASGVPVVTTSIAGIPELVVDGVNGRLVVPGRADLLADALASLAADPDLRQRCGAAGRRRIEEDFALPVTARAQQEFLRRAAGSGVTAGP